MAPTTDTYAERKEWLKRFCLDIAPAVASELSGLDKKVWTVEHFDQVGDGYYDRPRLKCFTGERLAISLNDVSKRGEIDGLFGTLPNGSTWIPRDAGVTCASPTFDATRPPEAIARVILNRFLKDYRACYAIYKERYASEQTHIDVTAAHARDLLAAGPHVLKAATSPYGLSASVGRGVTSWHLYFLDFAGHINVSGDTTKIELTCPPDIARDLIETLERLAHSSE